MSIVLLIRHGSNPTVGKILAGRMPGVHLDEIGKAQAEDLVERVGHLPIEGLYSSPLERTRETAAPLASKLGLNIRTSEKLLEVEIGDWTGRDFRELVKSDPRWRHYIKFRSGTRPPGGGELLIEVQERMVSEVERLRREHPDGAFAVFSHGDPIKSVIAHYAGFPLDFVLRFEVSLTSVSIISINDNGPRILCVNSLGRIPEFLSTL